MGFWETVKEYWGFVMFLAGLSFHALWTYFQVGKHNLEIEKLDERVVSLEKNHDVFREEIKGTLVEIKTSVAFIRESIAELKRK